MSDAPRMSSAGLRGLVGTESVPEDLLFQGISGVECEHFIAAVRRVALSQGKQRDEAWIADFASSCFVNGALRWYETLSENVQHDWRQLRQALLAQYPAETPISDRTWRCGPYLLTS